jgi:ABC-2 type transport system ATP-binding protein
MRSHATYDVDAAARNGGPAIRVEGVRKRFGSVQALEGISLTAEPGTVLALLGPNGAGKTTAVRILTTLLAPDGGSATVAGHDVVRDAAALRAAIGLAGQYAAVDEYLTGRENLVMIARLYLLSRAQSRRRAHDLLDRLQLTPAADRLTKTYSGGMRRRLDLAASLIARPRVVFLDEPTGGLDPRSRLALWELLRALVADGTTVLLTTQYLEEADQLADRVVVIDGGRVIAAGTPDELKSQIGGDRLEVRAAASRGAARVAEQLAALSSSASSVDERTGRVSVAVSRGDALLGEAVHRLDSAGIEIAEFALRRPTLDDVFLALTGHSSESPSNPSAPALTTDAPAGETP